VGSSIETASETITCLRCGAELTVLRDPGLALALTYDFDQWAAVCCCRDRMSPTACCSFLELEGVLGPISGLTPPATAVQ